MLDPQIPAFPMLSLPQYKWGEEGTFSKTNQREVYSLLPFFNQLTNILFPQESPHVIFGTYLSLLVFLHSIRDSFTLLHVNLFEVKYKILS